MAISGGLCDLHPGISAGFSASPAASYSGTLCPFSPTDKPSQSTLEYILSKTLGASHHCSLLTGERPNTDATFSVSLSTEPLLPSMANVLRANGIADLLKTYPNQRFVDTLTSIATPGARVGFQGNTSGQYGV